MLKNKLTCLILSCNKFSDLWDGNIFLFNEYWPDRDFDTYLVTDSSTDREYKGIEILCAGDNLEWSERLSFALSKVKTEFVFITLDDYFLIRPVDSKIISRMISLMESGLYDYLRLFPRPKRATLCELNGYNGVYHVNTSINYSVNLYSGIWRKSFIEFAVREPKSAWAFEVSLSKIARDYRAKCICSYNNDYKILDVVRKGKILHSANRYFKRHPGIYDGHRDIQSWQYEVGLWVKTMIGRHSPRFLYKRIKFVYKALGGHSFIDDN